MANAILWQAAALSRGTVLTTGLNALAAAATSAVDTEIDNSTNLDRFGWFEIGHGTKTEAAHAGDTVEIRMMRSYDGTNYEAGLGLLVAVVAIDVLTADALHIYMSNMFVLPPCKVKFTLKNAGAHAMLDTTNYVELFTSNTEVQ